MTDACVLILYPATLLRSSIGCNTPILEELPFKMGAVCILMAEEANDAGGWGERTATGVELLSSKRGGGDPEPRSIGALTKNLWTFSSSRIFFSVKWQEG